MVSQVNSFTSTELFFRRETVLKSHETMTEEQLYHHPINSFNDLESVMTINPDVPTRHSVDLRAEITRLKLESRDVLLSLL